jgi:endonuclease/exonuclease/phosphatase family metal-dependent hydrolase
MHWLIALLLGVGLLAGGCRTSSVPPIHRTLRVMTYNIHHGEGLDGKVDLARIAELIKREQADIVALQEVDKGVARTARRDLSAELAVLTGMTAVFSNNFHFQGGEYGNAVLTKFPMTSATNRHYQMLRTGEQRGVLQLTLDVHGREVVFMNTHIDYRPDDAERWLNVGEIELLARQYEGKPIILCGDFNDTPGSRIHARLAKTFVDAWAEAGNGDGLTIPVLSPRKRIDYIWLSKDCGFRTVEIHVPNSEASDHLPVVAELELK